jgi:oxaloacetate decarboxylase gamma subunit
MADLMSSGIGLMIAGMGIVYVFLAMLVLAINLMSIFAQRYFPEAPPKSRPMPSGLDKSTVAAITAAVHRYRNERR